MWDPGTHLRRTYNYNYGHFKKTHVHPQNSSSLFKSITKTILLISSTIFPSVAILFCPFPRVWGYNRKEERDIHMTTHTLRAVLWPSKRAMISVPARSQFPHSDMSEMSQISCLNYGKRLGNISLLHSRSSVGTTKDSDIILPLGF